MESNTGFVGNFITPRISKIQTLTSGTLYTPTPGTVAILVEVIGGGGGGGGVTGNSASEAAAGGGGGGGYASKFISGLLSSTYTYAIGAAGAGGAAGANNGAIGGTTSFSLNGTPLVQATGGNGGIGMALLGAGVFATAGGTGGVGIGGDVNLNGSVGYPGIGAFDSGVSACITSGRGGNSPKLYGVGDTEQLANNATAGAAGKTGLGYGGGGGGAFQYTTASNFAGGSGSAGVLVITEFS